MKVLKFGGTSVGTIESLQNVKKIVDAISEPAVVVVSALGGLTDKLIATANKAASGDASFREDMKGIRERHENIVAGVVPAERQQTVLEKINPLLDELSRLYEGVSLVYNLSPRTLDLIVSFGERISSIIVAHAVSEASHVDSLQVVKTERWFAKNIADTELTNKNIREVFATLGKDGNPKIAVMGGFISTDRDSGEVTNLGRGGSDYTAALVAACLDASVLEIWTDVDGFMTADPRIVKTAIVLDKLSFVESMELCTFGAKVVYPPTIYPVFHKGIPIRVLNTFNPEAPGTWICDTNNRDDDGRLHVKGVSLLKDTTLITISGSEMDNVCEINSRTFNMLARRGVAVRLVDQPDDDSVFSIAIEGKESETAMRVLQEEFAPELISGAVNRLEAQEGLTTLAVVGENMKRHQGTAHDLNALFRAADINVYASTVGVSETTAAFVIDADRANEALLIAHNYCFPV